MSLCSSGYPQIHATNPAPPTHMLGLQMCTVPSLNFSNCIKVTPVIIPSSSAAFFYHNQVVCRESLWNHLFCFLWNFNMENDSVPETYFPALVPQWEFGDLYFLGWGTPCVNNEKVLFMALIPKSSCIAFLLSRRWFYACTWWSEHTYSHCALPVVCQQRNNRSAIPTEWLHEQV